MPASTNSGQFGYTGQLWLPDLGMYWCKSRVYNPTLGRFMQTDPIGYGDGMNMYGYVKGDPVNKIDPLGQFGHEVCGVVVGYWQAQVSYDGGKTWEPDPDNPNPRPDYGCVGLRNYGGGGNAAGGGAGVGAVGAGPKNKFPNPSTPANNVRIEANLVIVADVVGISIISGTLTDTRPGGSVVSFSATTTRVVGLAAGSYTITGTLPGFDSLDSGFQFSFFDGAYGLAASGARFTRGGLGPANQFGKVDISATRKIGGPFSVTSGLPAGAAAMKFNNGAKRSTTGERTRC